MICNGRTLLNAAPIQLMHTSKNKYMGTSFGLSEAGYDIRIAEDITFYPATWRKKAYCERTSLSKDKIKTTTTHIGKSVLASTIDRFQMPKNLVGVVHDKSTWARQFLSVYNTVIEPNWHGYLTLELVFHGEEVLKIQCGQGIAQVLFSYTIEDGDYGDGKYQNQEAGPVESRS